MGLGYKCFICFVAFLVMVDKGAAPSMLTGMSLDAISLSRNTC